MASGKVCTSLFDHDPRLTQYRYRNTSSFIELALLHPEMDPNEVLNHFYYGMCGYWPVDHEFSQPEPESKIFARHLPIVTPSMSEKLLNSTSSTLFLFPVLSLIRLLDHQLYDLLLVAMMDYVVSGKLRYQDDDAKTLVEIGIALFCDEGEDACIREPIAIYAMVDFFKKTGFTVEAYLRRTFTSARGTSYGNVYEEILAWQLFRAFQKSWPLDEIFDFCGDAPEWAEERAQLIGIARDGDGVDFLTFPTGCAMPFARKAKDETESLDWASNPRGIPILFPDIHCGPDLILVLQTEAKEHIVVLVQSRYTRQEKLKDIPGALATVNPDLFYMVNVRVFAICTHILLILP